MTRIIPFSAIILWLAALGVGMGLMMESDARPGPPGLVPEIRNVASVSTGDECIVFLHPKCPCARDTLILLARMEFRDPRIVRIRIVFTGPSGADEVWWSGKNLDLAMLVPGASVERDAGGEVARDYGVRTSGHTLVYAAGGKLLFSGGIAPLPGVSAKGDAISPALDAVLRGSAGAPRTRPVRGCPLFDE